MAFRDIIISRTSNYVYFVYNKNFGISESETYHNLKEEHEEHEKKKSNNNNLNE